MVDDARVLPPTDDELRQAFRLIDDRLAVADAGESLRLLRERLVGELVCDADRVATTLAVDFELVTHAGGSTTSTSRPVVIDSIRRQGEPGEPGAVIWVVLDDVLVDGDRIAGHGTLRTMRPLPASMRPAPRRS